MGNFYEYFCGQYYSDCDELSKIAWSADSGKCSEGDFKGRLTLFMIHYGKQVDSEMADKIYWYAYDGNHARGFQEVLHEALHILNSLFR